MFAPNDHQMLQCPPKPLLIERRWKSNAAEVAPNCPRCSSSNTKFCYYNNYSFSQPRYFCKGCRRYWTKGGSLRNVPVGGGCRKTHRSKPPPPSQNQQPSTGITTTNLPTGGPTTGSGIDLAAVFAQFLNPNPSENPDAQIENLTVSSGTQSGFSQVVAAVDLSREEERIGGFVGEFDPNCFGFQTVISDGLVDQDDLLWSDSTSLPNFEFGSFLSDDQLKISANLIGDNWSPLDLSGYEVFSEL